MLSPAPGFISDAAIQDPYELRCFISFLQAHNVRSYLEIGALFGGTFESVVMNLPNLERAYALDLKVRPELARVAERLKHDRPRCFVRTIEGDSADLKLRQDVVFRGDFDAIFIDADHRYEAVKRDWKLYGSYGRFVAFHDIAKEDGWIDRSGVPIDVPRLWRELCSTHATTEFVSPGSFKGIGIVKR